MPNLIHTWRDVPARVGGNPFTLMFTGHRPAKLGVDIGAITGRIRFLLETAYSRRGTDLVVITGMAQGIDTIAADISIKLGIRVWAFTAFPGQESRWPKREQQHFHTLMQQAEAATYVFPNNPKNKMQAGFFLNGRNTAMVECSDAG